MDDNEIRLEEETNGDSNKDLKTVPRIRRSSRAMTGFWLLLILLAVIQIRQVMEVRVITRDIRQLLDSIRANRGAGKKEELFHQPKLPLDQTLAAIIKLEELKRPQISLTKEQCRKLMTLTLRMRFFMQFRRENGQPHEEEEKLAGQVWSIVNPMQAKELKTMGGPLPPEKLLVISQAFYQMILSKLKEY